MYKIYSMDDSGNEFETLAAGGRTLRSALKLIDMCNHITKIAIVLVDEKSVFRPKCEVTLWEALSPKFPITFWMKG